ncbi:calmodulin-4-like isoform X1 [Cimex lectularius]|uniref:EF-hand domain-containing protein n=1 Tax=Cimex lectularius TaxID=79782 RepID=A0A8I6RPY4_CIMLE|nr:calmodulin-4-like isoform X1 [Cimex lectularius]
MSRFMRSRGKQTAVEKIQQLYKRPHRPPPPVHYLLSAKEVSENRKLFSYFDRNRDGLLDEKEYFDLINFETSNQTRYSNLENVFSSNDSNSDGRISETEFLNYRGKLKMWQPNQDDVHYLFDACDRNSDQLLSFDEFKAVWRELGEYSSKRELKYLFDRYDRNRESKITKEDLWRMVKQNLKRTACRKQRHYQHVPFDEL